MAVDEEKEKGGHRAGDPHLINSSGKLNKPFPHRIFRHDCTRCIFHAGPECSNKHVRRMHYPERPRLPEAYEVCKGRYRRGG